MSRARTPTVCLETMGSYQRQTGVELYQPPGSFRLGRRAQVKALQPSYIYACSSSVSFSAKEAS